MTLQKTGRANHSPRVRKNWKERALHRHGDVKTKRPRRKLAFLLFLDIFIFCVSFHVCHFLSILAWGLCVSPPELQLSEQTTPFLSLAGQCHLEFPRRARATALGVSWPQIPPVVRDPSWAAIFPSLEWDFLPLSPRAGQQNG